MQAYNQQSTTETSTEAQPQKKKGYSTGKELLTLIQRRDDARKSIYSLAGEQGAITNYSHGQVILG